MNNSNIRASKRVAKNTLFLYFRTLLVMTITIYTSRIILDVLGVEDYGIYNVVGGFVTMFSVLSGTLTAASQRYIAYELGKKKSDVKNIFSNIITIHLLMAMVMLVLLETAGLWFLNCKMNIAPERVTAANWVFHFSVITFCVNLISIPYNSAIIAYEKMSVFAYFSIFEVVSKLAAIYALYAIQFDSLIVYAGFMLIIAVILRFVYGFYTTKHFPDCRFKLSFDKQAFKEMIVFSGWNFIGSSAAILNGQGINLLINLFFGVTFNAARGIATQVDNAINTFVQNFMMALNPQITKSYAAQDYPYVNRMIYLGTKYAFFLFWILAFPVFLNTDYILSVWLKQVPDYTTLFIRLGIIYNLAQTLSQCLYTAMLATGRIKKYQLIVGGLSLLAFPATYVFYMIGLPSEWGYWSMIIFSVVCLIARLFLLREMVPLFSIKDYTKGVVVPLLYTLIPSAWVIILAHRFFQSKVWLGFLLETTWCVTITCVFVYLIGLSKTERGYIRIFVFNKCRRNK